MVLVIKNVGEKSLAKMYHFLGLLFVVSNIYVKLVNKRLVNYLEKCGLELASEIEFDPQDTIDWGRK